jgi:hypothetical protein
MYSFYKNALFLPKKVCEHPMIVPDKRFGRPDPIKSDESFKIVIILDESGSMESIKDSMIRSLNDLIKEQKQIKGGKPTTFTLVKFNDKVKRVINNKPLEEVNLLSSEDYSPNGSTALYDCIGDTIERFRNEQDVLMVIITDGQENASRDYTKREVTKMIEDKKKYDNWTYVYLSCDLGTFGQGNDLGFANSSFATNVQISKDGYGSYMSNNFNSALENYRKKGTSVQMQLNR